MSTYNIVSENWIKYKTFITQELLKNKILGANTTYVSINHTDKILNKYFKILDNIFLKIKKCEISVLEIDDLLESEICHTGFKRLN